jgi:hypothetical protein
LSVLLWCSPCKFRAQAWREPFAPSGLARSVGYPTFNHPPRRLVAEAQFFLEPPPAEPRFIGASKRESNMRNTFAAMLAAVISTAAFAQTSEFYVVQDVKTKRCTIVDKRPATTTEMTVVGNGVYKTRAEAETGMKSVKVCTTN